MWKFLHRLAAVCAAVTAALLLGWLYTKSAVLETLLITAVTVLYHILMRMCVGNFWNARLHNHADYRRRWFQVSPREERLYRKLNVRRWKNKMPTYDPESFNSKTHSWDTLAQTTCQSELVHETNVVLSFLPLAAVPFAGSLPAFLITSLLAAAADSLFVIMQRFNRGRMVQLIDHQQRRHEAAAL